MNSDNKSHLNGLMPSLIWSVKASLGVVALLLSVPSAHADYMPTPVPYGRLPQSSATLNYSSQYSNGSSHQPYAMLPPPDPSYHPRATPYNLNSLGPASNSTRKGSGASSAPPKRIIRSYASSAHENFPFNLSAPSSIPDDQRRPANNDFRSAANNLKGAPNYSNNFSSGSYPANNFGGGPANPYSLNAQTDANFRRPDKFTDAPQVDSDGVRHFANGRHFDLSKTSLDDAIAQTNSSTLGGNNKRNLKNGMVNAGNSLNMGRGSIDPNGFTVNNGNDFGYKGDNFSYDRGNNLGYNNANNFPYNRGNNFSYDRSNNLGYNNGNNFPHNRGNNFSYDRSNNLGYNNGNNFNYNGGNNFCSNPYGANNYGYNQNPHRGFVRDWSQSPNEDMYNQNYAMQARDWRDMSQNRLAMRNRRRMRNMQIRDYQW